MRKSLSVSVRVVIQLVTTSVPLGPFHLLHIGSVCVYRTASHSRCAATTAVGPSACRVTALTATDGCDLPRIGRSLGVLLEVWEGPLGIAPVVS
jgi:hypothetical protein